MVNKNNIIIYTSKGGNIKVDSKRTTEFRIWATKMLKEYMIKDFSLNYDNGVSSYNLKDKLAMNFFNLGGALI